MLTESSVDVLRGGLDEESEVTEKLAEAVPMHPSEEDGIPRDDQPLEAGHYFLFGCRFFPPASDFLLHYDSSMDGIGEIQGHSNGT